MCVTKSSAAAGGSRHDAGDRRPAGPGSTELARRARNLVLVIDFGTADRSEPLPVVGIHGEKVAPSSPAAPERRSANVHHAPQKVPGGASGATTVIQTQAPSQSLTRTFRLGQPLSSTVGDGDGVEVFKDVVVLGGLVGLDLAMDLAVGAVPGAAVAAAGAETVTATAIEVTAVTAASARRVVDE